MFKRFLNALKSKDLRRKIFFTTAMLILYRLAAHIPLPGVDTSQLADFVSGNQFFGLLDVFSGGGLSSLSVVMLGVGPYITASIVIQLLTQVVPRLHELQKESGEAGQKKINQYTRILSVPLGAIQAYGTMIVLNQSSHAGGSLNIFTDLNPFLLAQIVIVAVAGSIFLMWLGELITEYGIGNGISLIIFAGIVSQLPDQYRQTQATLDTGSFLPLLGLLAVILAIIAGVVFITQAQRNIPVRYARQIRGSKSLGGASSHLPLRVNHAGVIPIIFALSILLFPGLIANFTAGSDNATIASFSQSVVEFFNNQTYYAITYFILVVVFTYFYTSIVFEPQSIAENVQKQGGFIPGIRPGPPTARHLGYVMNRIVPAGAIFLGIIAVMPFMLQGAFNITTISIGGTSLLIVVSVIMDTLQKVESQVVEHEYVSVVRRAF